MADRTLHDNIDALHGYAASRRGIAVDHEKAAASGRPGGLRNVTLHVHLSGHHVFRNAGPGISVDYDGRALVHSGAVVADMAFDLHEDGGIDANRDRMPAARIEYAPMRFVAVELQPVKRRVKLAQRRMGEIDRRHH